MPSLTNRLRLKRHTLADRFQIQDYTDNWLTLDGHPGDFICTSGTRPATWTTENEGMSIIETDTLLRYSWDGAAFQRIEPRGSVGRAERLSDISTTSTTYSTVVSTGAISVYARRHLVIVEAPGVYSTEDLTGLAIFRDGTMLQEWSQTGGTAGTAIEQPRPISMVTSDLPTEGTFTYTLQFKALIGFGGTCYVQGNTNKPIAIHVVEV